MFADPERVDAALGGGGMASLLRVTDLLKRDVLRPNILSVFMASDSRGVRLALALVAAFACGHDCASSSASKRKRRAAEEVSDAVLDARAESSTSLAQWPRAQSEARRTGWVVMQKDLM